MYENEESKIDAMLRKIEEQRGAGGAEGYTLYGFSDAHLHNVHLDIRSFIGKGAGARVPLPVLSAENTVLRAEPNQPSDIEALAERLAKVEDCLAGARSAHIATLDQRVVDERLKALDDRITKVAEIIGERVSGMVNDNNMILDSVKRAHERVDELRDHIGLNGTADGRTLGDKVLRMVAAMPPEMRAAYEAGGEPALRAAFPTGGAGPTAAATDAVLPVPQRGDRVRLEGAGRRELTGWYDVTGSNSLECAFQVAVGDGGRTWLRFDEPGLKEVRHVTE